MPQSYRGYHHKAWGGTLTATKSHNATGKTRLVAPNVYTGFLWHIKINKKKKALKQPSSHFNIYDYTSFSTANTRSSSSNKLNHVHSSNNYTRNFYFNRITRLWNKLPIINLNLSLPTIKAKIYSYLHQHFTMNFIADNPCTYHFCCRCSNCYNVGISHNF